MRTLIEPFYQVAVISFLFVYTLDRFLARLQARDFLHSIEELTFPSDDPIMTSGLDNSTPIDTPSKEFNYGPLLQEE